MFLMLACAGRRGLRQLALTHQSRHLGCHRVGLIVIIVLVKDAKHVLLLGGGISVMACSGHRRVEAMLERLLDEGLQGNPHLQGRQEPVPLLKWPLVETSCEEETDCVINQLAPCRDFVPKLQFWCNF